MSYDFRNKMLNNEKFNNLFSNYYDGKKIIEIPSDIWDIISADKRLNSIDNLSLTFEEILRNGYNEGRCYQCATNLALLLHLNGYDVNQVIGKNNFFKGTKGSPNGGHYWLEFYYNNIWYVLDTSLLCMIEKYNSYTLGYESIKSIKAEDMLLDSDYLTLYEEIKREFKRKRR